MAKCLKCGSNNTQALKDLDGMFIICLSCGHESQNRAKVLERREEVSYESMLQFASEASDNQYQRSDRMILVEAYKDDLTNLTRLAEKWGFIKPHEEKNS